MPATTSTPHDVVFLFDCDNTLLDNDHVLADLRAHMMREFGAENSARYWEIFENLRAELGYADYLGALQRYRSERPRDTRLLLMSSFLIEYPFANRLYPGALDALDHVGKRGPTVILSDGDVVFQPRKIARSGLWDEVEGRVLIYIHKELMLDQVMECYPARHYVMVDDKLRILTAMKKVMGQQTDDGVSPSGALCVRSEGDRQQSTGGCDAGADRRIGGDRRRRFVGGERLAVRGVLRISVCVSCVGRCERAACQARFDL
jgi:Predicted hydrolase (HAD superfamily)